MENNYEKWWCRSFACLPQTYFLPFSGSALYRQGQPKGGRGRAWESGRKGDTWVLCFLSVSGSNSSSVSSSQTAPLGDPSCPPHRPRQACLNPAVSRLSQPLRSGNTISCLLPFVVKNPVIFWLYILHGHCKKTKQNNTHTNKTIKRKMLNYLKSHYLAITIINILVCFLPVFFCYKYV